MVKNTMKPMIKCANCGRMVPANPRVKNQNYCNRKACQRVRKNKWKQSKIASDPDYKKDTGIAINSGLNGIQDIMEIIENRTRIIVIETVNYRKNGIKNTVQNDLAKETR